MMAEQETKTPVENRFKRWLELVEAHAARAKAVQTPKCSHDNVWDECKDCTP